MNDLTVIDLCNSISLKQGLIVLNLSNNKITDKSCNSIQNMLLKNYSLKEFYIRWNKITQIGGQKVINGVLTREVIAVLDLSWNRLNRCPKLHKKQVN